MNAPAFPRFRPVAERAILVEFGETIDEAVHERVLGLDAALAAAPIAGFVEAVPAYASLLVCFDPFVTDHKAVGTALGRLIADRGAPRPTGRLHDVEVCYDADLAPDLGAVAKAAGCSADAVVAAHLSGDYKVYMYGFAPGYAYLAGVPEAIRMPRKPAAVRGIPAGSVLIAGPQCLVSTLEMPTGWWIIGRSPTPILDLSGTGRSFLFDVGDRVRFRRVARERLQDPAVRAGDTP